MRSDARRNHDHILEAARELFGEAGTKVSVEEIARAAGVGVGTVHRHFPTKDDLVGAVLVWSCEPVLDALEDALKGDDPLAGLESFLLQIVEFQQANRALAEEFRDEGHGEVAELVAIKAEMTDRLAELVHRVQERRPDPRRRRARRPPAAADGAGSRVGARLPRRHLRRQDPLPADRAGRPADQRPHAAAGGAARALS